MAYGGLDPRRSPYGGAGKSRSHHHESSDGPTWRSDPVIGSCRNMTGLVMQHAGDSANELSGAGWLRQVAALRVGIMRMRVASVEHEGDVASIEALAHCAGIIVAQPEVQHGG